MVHANTYPSRRLGVADDTVPLEEIVLSGDYKYLLAIFASYVSKSSLLTRPRALLGSLDCLLGRKMITLRIVEDIRNPFLKREAFVPRDGRRCRRRDGRGGSGEGDKNGKAESSNREVDHFEGVGMLLDLVK